MTGCRPLHIIVGICFLLSIEAHASDDTQNFVKALEKLARAHNVDDHFEEFLFGNFGKSTPSSATAKYEEEINASSSYSATNYRTGVRIRLKGLNELQLKVRDHYTFSLKNSRIYVRFNMHFNSEERISERRFRSEFRPNELFQDTSMKGKYPKLTDYLTVFYIQNVDPKRISRMYDDTTYINAGKVDLAKCKEHRTVFFDSSRVPVHQTCANFKAMLLVDLSPHIQDIEALYTK